jgi:hypothetical protein
MKMSTTNRNHNYTLDNTKKNGEVLYYPGAGMDYGPFIRFSEQIDVKTVIYTDYGMKKGKATEFLSAIPGWSTEQVSNLQPQDLGLVASWEQFWPVDPESRKFAKPDSAFGLRARLVRQHDGVSVDFIYLATEAVQTYANLLLAGLCPTIVVLQDHGFGANWTKFGGPAELFGQAQVALPRYLLVAKGTDVWPGYARVSNGRVDAGQMHSFERAIFERMSGDETAGTCSRTQLL